MCGISGIWGLSDGMQDTLESQSKALSHRGPDSSGIWHEDLIGFAISDCKVL